MADHPDRVSLAVIAGQWSRIGCTGFGGPPVHIALLRKLCVQDRGWLTGQEFEDGIAAVNLLPGPASTQLAIYCAWRLRGAVGALVGGTCFIVPGLAVILGLSAAFLSGRPPAWVPAAALGAGAAVPAVALAAAAGLAPASWQRTPARVRWGGYVFAGAAAAALIGPWLVLVLAGCGLAEVMAGPARTRLPGARSAGAAFPAAGGMAAAVATGGLGALAWVAVKVGALSYGGGFVIVPLMQHDAVHAHHWMTAGQFLTAVALGQVTPGPVVQTVAVVGYAAAGVGGGLLAAAIAFTPSFAFVLAGGRRFDRLRGDARARAFLAGAGPAAIGAIAGVAVPLGLALTHPWQAGVLTLAAVWLIVLRRGVVTGIGGAAALGVLVYLAGGPAG